MFNIGEKVKMDLYDKSVHRFGYVIEIKTVRGKTAYVIKFKSGRTGTYFESELLKIQ